MCGPMTVLLSLRRFINPLQKALAISTEETKTYSTEKFTEQSMRIWAVWGFPVRATATLSLNACVDAGSSDIFHSSSKVRRLSFGPCSFKLNPTHVGGRGYNRTSCISPRRSPRTPAGDRRSSTWPCRKRADELPSLC